jgi:hypothetical protein
MSNGIQQLTTGPLMDILSTLFRLQSRKIGVIIPDVVVSEKHSDTLEITEHLWKQGLRFQTTPISAIEVVMEVGFAGGGACWILPATDSTFAGYEPARNVSEIAGPAIQTEPFDVVTGKRIYNNMLIRAWKLPLTKQQKTYCRR